MAHSCPREEMPDKGEGGGTDTEKGCKAVCSVRRSEMDMESDKRDFSGCNTSFGQLSCE